MQRSWLACVLVGVVSACAGASAGPPAPAPMTLVLTPVSSPAAPGAMAPQLSVAPDGTTLMSWIEPAADGQKALRWSRLRDGRWSEAATITTAADFFANWADVPSIIQLRDGRMAAHWLRKSASSTYAYHVALSISADGGRTWSDPMTPHGDRSDTEHGFVSMFERADGQLGLVWLDGRQMAMPEPTAGAGAARNDGAGSGSRGGRGGHGGDHGMGGSMMLRATTIGRDGTAGADIALDDRVCECCPTTAAVTTSGVVVAYRDRGATEVRDIGVARFDGASWTRPALVHADNWMIEACPVNGPALAARGAQVALAWFTAEGDRPRVSVAFSSDEAQRFGAPIPVSDAAAVGRVDAELLDDGSALVAWIEHGAPVSSLRVKRVWPDGRATASHVVTPLTSGRGSGYPRMMRMGQSLVLAWTDPATQSTPSTIRTATAPLPQ